MPRTLSARRHPRRQIHLVAGILDSSHDIFNGFQGVSSISRRLSPSRCSRCSDTRGRGEGNSLIVIERNPYVIKSADWIVDLGSEGGKRGGRVVAEGTPEVVAQVEASLTVQFLGPLLAEAASGRPSVRPSQNRVRSTAGPREDATATNPATSKAPTKATGKAVLAKSA